MGAMKKIYTYRGNNPPQQGLAIEQAKKKTLKRRVGRKQVSLFGEKL